MLLSVMLGCGSQIFFTVFLTLGELAIFSVIIMHLTMVCPRMGGGGGGEPMGTLTGHFEYTSKSNTKFEDSVMSLCIIFFIFHQKLVAGQRLVKRCN